MDKRDEFCEKFILGLADAAENIAQAKGRAKARGPWNFQCPFCGGYFPETDRDSHRESCPRHVGLSAEEAEREQLRRSRKPIIDQLRAEGKSWSQIAEIFNKYDNESDDSGHHRIEPAD